MAAGRYGGRVGIIVGWVLQKRWLTLAAFVLNVVAVLTFPRLPAPINYLWVLAPVVLIMAVFYEGGAAFGPRISPRVRLAFALWMGLCGLALLIGIEFAGSTATGLIATIAVFSVLALVGILVVAVIYRRQLRYERAGPAVANSRSS